MDIDQITQKVYRDEAISPAGIMLTPPKYRQMRQLAVGGTRAEIFLRQARFMQDHTDFFPYKGDFQCYYPTYEDMTTQQLRGYFTWRTAAREGIYEQTCTGFVFVYIYELINGIGGSAQQRYQRLKELLHAYGNHPAVAKYLPVWMDDLAILNGFGINDDKEPQYKYAEVLYKAEEHSPREVLEALCALSSYGIEKSKIYTKYPEETDYTVYLAYRYISEHYQSMGGESFFMRLLGSCYEAPYQMFAGAVYLPQEHEDCTVEINLFKRYICRDGRWYLTKLLEYRSGARRIAELLKGIDNFLRKKYGVSPELKNASLNAVRQGLVEKAYADGLRRIAAARRREATKRVVIDLSALDGIREDADVVAQRLTVEHEEPDTWELENEVHDHNNADMCNCAYGDIEDETKPESAENLQENSHDEYGLDDVELEYIRLLLQGGDPRAMLRSRAVMQSVVSESINQKLFDLVGDTVLDADGSIIEDYFDDLKGIVER